MCTIYSDYLNTYEKEKSKLENLQILKSERKTKSQKIRDFINKINGNGEIITEFSDGLFFATIEKITVNSDRTAILLLKTGSRLKFEKIEHNHTD